ncbi:hypothetical protein CC86DRAFT_376735 [Ophiobolus disseminans]|uniref:Uncharacterized protein n=1 Tax=Ophiobolus disseminans TaxID=1469910 RepID=A0A6A7AM37_9PLEO|nr:hypothetical protein CC86DRAFT_376735 [Ophiobolus disseminans]
MKPARKRQRANTNDDSVSGHTSTSTTGPPATRQELSDYIDILLAEDGGRYVRETLISLARSDHAIMSELSLEYDALAAENQAEASKEAKMIVHFGDMAEACARGQMQDDYKCTVPSAIVDHFKQVVETVSSPNALFGARCSALLALWKIAMYICSAPGQIGRAVRKYFRDNMELEETLDDVLKKMTDGERRHLCGAAVGRKTLLRRMQDLERLAQKSGVLQDLNIVIARLRNEEVPCNDPDDLDHDYESSERMEVPLRGDNAVRGSLKRREHVAWVRREWARIINYDALVAKLQWKLNQMDNSNSLPEWLRKSPVGVARDIMTKMRIDASRKHISFRIRRSAMLNLVKIGYIICASWTVEAETSCKRCGG